MNTRQGIAIAMTPLLVGCVAIAETGQEEDLAGVPATLRSETVVAFTEGPTVDRGGHVYFSEMLEGRILRYSPEEAIVRDAPATTESQRALRRALGGGHPQDHRPARRQGRHARSPPASAAHRGVGEEIPGESRTR